MDNKTFFETLWGEEEGFAEIRYIDKDKVAKSKFFEWPEEKEKFLNHAKALSFGNHVYFGVGLRANREGTAKDVQSLPGVWCDLDFKLSSEAKARKKLEEFKLKPSISVESGGGLHLYWLFKEPIKPVDPEATRALNLRIAACLTGDPAACDVARILRIPGSFNFKYKPAPTVSVTELNEARYVISDFDFLPRLEKKKESKPNKGKVKEVFKEGERNQGLLSIAGTMRRKGLEPDEIEQALLVINQKRCLPPLEEDEVARISKSAGRYEPQVNILTQVANVQINSEGEEEPASTSVVFLHEKLGLSVNSHGIAHANVDNVTRIFQNDDTKKNIVWFDEFHQKYFTMNGNGRPREWNDIDDIHTQAVLQRDYGFVKVGVDVVSSAIRLYANSKKRNEPKEWMETLKWDGERRIEHFFPACVGADSNPYTRKAGENFWIGMVARVYKPGCQLDNMVVLEGKQGIGKTNALRAIGGYWYTEAHEAVTSKDFYLALKGKLLVEIAELDSFSRAEVTRIKQVITCKTDCYRAPYARVAQDNPRQCIFVGTTNETNYLRDNTGGRRFWPIKCGKIDLEAITNNRNLFFAEAVARFKSGEGWYEMPQETETEQEQRRQVDEWEEPISAYLDNPIKSEVTVFELATECLKIDIGRIDRQIQMRICSVIKKLGWELPGGKPTWRDGKALRIYKLTTSPVVMEKRS